MRPRSTRGRRRGPAKVARNLTRSFFEIGHKRCNFNGHISMSEICARELRATLLGNQSDWKPTHETTYQHTRRRCDGRRMVRRARAGFATRRRAKRDRQVSRADGPRDARNNATAAAPVTERDTRYGARHPIRRGALPTDRVRTQSQEQTRNLRDDRRHTPGPGSSLSLMRFCAGGNATRTRPRELALPGPQHTAISQHSTSRRRGRRRQ